MSTGVSVADETVKKFNDFKKTGSGIVFQVYKIDGPQVVLETESSSKDFNDFLNALPAEDCRFAMYTMEFDTEDGRPTSKVVNIAW